MFCQQEPARAREIRVRLQLTLPDDFDPPSKRPQIFDLASVPAPVRLKLRNPVFRPGCRRSSGPTVVAVPEAAVHEHGEPSPGENEIGAARQRPNVQPISPARRMNRPTQPKLWASVLLANGAHDL
jgi:hypothetical protein